MVNACTIRCICEYLTVAARVSMSLLLDSKAYNMSLVTIYISDLAHTLPIVCLKL